MKNWVILAVAGGFYYFGNEIEAVEGYVKLDDVSMFGGFSGGKGLPGLQRHDKSMTVVLDKFENGTTLTVPLSAVYGIIKCEKSLYDFKGTTLR